MSPRLTPLSRVAFWLLACLNFVDGIGCTRSADSGAPPAPVRAKSIGAASASTKPPALKAPAGDSAAASSSKPRGAQAPQAGLSARYPRQGRLVALGDVHGDLAATRAALRLAGAVEPGSERWSGGALTVVQTGDQLDRGDDERAILDWFARLEREASEAGGRFIVLNGNHETMNVMGDFRYATPAGLRAFESAVPASPWAGQVPAKFQARAAALLPGGQYALQLAERDVVALVGDTVFVHGGVLPEHLAYGLGRINREVRRWMRQGGPPPASLRSERSVVWARTYSAEPVDAQECALLGEVLESLGAVRMVVGHTTQKNGISSACGDRVYRVDVGLSSYYGQGPIQVLEINHGQVRVLSAPR